MLPVRLRLAGFLSYREPQELNFDEARLWLLTGPNGAGKSGVFDAITWALFGQHRGGMSAGDLIHKSAARCDVEFDFQLGNHLYRIDRSLRATRSGVSGTQAVYKRHGHEWHPEPETQRKTDFDDWIHRHLGLSFEAFTASVMLKQGRAEQLLDSSSKGREAVLASVLRLERYERLHERARQEMLRRQAMLDAMQSSTAIGGGIGAEDWAALTRRAAAAEAELEAARRSVRVCEALARLADAESRLSDAANLERDYARHQELTAVLPVAERIQNQRARRSESEHNTRRYEQRRTLILQEREILERDMATAQARKEELTRSLAIKDDKGSLLNRRIRDLNTAMESVRRIEALNVESRRLEAETRQFPADLTEHVEKTARLVERLAAIELRLPVMERVHQERSARNAAEDRRRAARAECDRIRSLGEAARREQDAIRRKCDAATSRLAGLDSEVAVAEARACLLREELHHLEQLRDEPMCRFCGQPLTDRHWRDEQARRAELLRTAQAALAECKTIRDDAGARTEKLCADVATATERVLQLRGEYQEQSANANAAERDMARHEQAIAQAKAALDGEVPDETGLKALRDEVAGLPDARRSLQGLRDQAATLAALRRQLSQLNASRVRESDPQSDLRTLREELAAAQTQEESLIQEIKTDRRALEEADRAFDRLARRGHELLAELTDLTGRLRSEEATRRQCDDALARELQSLASDWQSKLQNAGLPEIATWHDALRHLNAERVPDRFHRLAGDRSAIATLRREAELPGTSDCLSPDVAARRLDSARYALRIAEDAAADLRQQLRDCERREQRHDEAARRMRVTACDRDRWRRLAELLGSDKLQRHLLRMAETDIVARANAQLPRLFEHPPTLQITSENDRNALELQATLTGGRPIGVAFLSGSQRFRVAVALALALGAFASGADAQCLMIDEGFSSLDAHNRQLLRQEIRSLSRKLGRILVIGHDDDIIPEAGRYHFELMDGATRVRRITA